MIVIFCNFKTMKTTIKWTGEDTLIRKEFGGENIPVKSGGTIEVDKSVAEELSRLYPDRVHVMESKVKKAVVQPKKIEKASVETKKSDKK
jgi:hypothetical protein